TWWRKRLPIDRRPSARTRQFRPRLEALDGKIMPSVTYHGGPVIPHVEVHDVFYGQSWNTNDFSGARRYLLNQFQADITKSPYLAMLGEYGVGRGQAGTRDDAPQDASSPASGTTVTEG